MPDEVKVAAVETLARIAGVELAYENVTVGPLVLMACTKVTREDMDTYSEAMRAVEDLLGRDGDDRARELYVVKSTGRIAALGDIENDEPATVELTRAEAVAVRAYIQGDGFDVNDIDTVLGKIGEEP